MPVTFSYARPPTLPAPYLASPGGDDHAPMRKMNENEHASSPPLEGNRGKKENIKSCSPYPVLQRDLTKLSVLQRDFQDSNETFKVTA